MAVDERNPKKIKDNPVTNIKIEFSVLVVVNSFNQVEFIKLPSLENSNQN